MIRTSVDAGDVVTYPAIPAMRRAQLSCWRPSSGVKIEASDVLMDKRLNFRGVCYSFFVASLPQSYVKSHVMPKNNVTCHPTQVDASRIITTVIDRPVGYSICLTHRDGRLS